MKSTNLILVLGLTCCTVDFAQADYFVNANTYFYNSADIKGTNQDVSTDVYTIAVGNEYFTLAYKHTDYDFSGTEYIDNKDYWLLDAHLNGMFTDTFGYFFGAGAAMGYEDDIHLTDNYSLMARGGLAIAFNRMITGFLGVYGQYNEAEPQCLPIVGIKIGNERQTGWSGALAYPYTKLTYRFNPMFSVDGSLITTRELTQLSDDSIISRKGYMLEESYSVGLNANFTPIKLVTITAGVNYLFDRELSFYNHSGDEFASWETDPSAGFNVSARINF